MCVQCDRTIELLEIGRELIKACREYGEDPLAVEASISRMEQWNESQYALR